MKVNIHKTVRCPHCNKLLKTDLRKIEIDKASIDELKALFQTLYSTN